MEKYHFKFLPQTILDRIYSKKAWKSRYVRNIVSKIVDKGKVEKLTSILDKGEGWNIH